MAIKLSSLAYSTRVPKWIKLTSWISSTSCSNHIESLSDNILFPPDSSEFERNYQILRNRLVPDNLIRVLDDTSDLNSAVKIFKWASLQKRFRHTGDTYSRIILKLGLAGKVKEMEDFCENMVRDRCPGVEEVLVGLVETFVKHSRLGEALRVFLNMKLGGFKPSIDVYNVLLGALVKENRGLEDVLFVYKEIAKEGILPTVETLNCLMEALFLANRVELALDQYRRMGKKGCKPSSRTFEILVKGLIEKNEVDEAISVLGEMFELRCEPDLSFYSSLIPFLCMENKIDEGIRFYKMMRASNYIPNSVVYGALIHCLCHNLKLDFAINILNDMTESGVSPDYCVFVDLVNCFCELGKINEASVFLENRNVLQTPPYEALLRNCCNAGNILFAHIVFDKMSERNIVDSSSWNVIIRWLCENDMLEKAFELVGRMITSSFSLDSATYSALIVGHCRLSKYETALQLFYQVYCRNWVLDLASYSNLVEGLCQVKKIKEASEVFYYMSMKGCSLDSLSLYMLIKEICGLGQINEAIRLRKLAYCSGTSCSNGIYITIMSDLSESQRAKDLLVFLSQMLVEGYGLDLEAHCILIQSMIEQSRINNSILLFNMMVNKGLIPDSRRVFAQLSQIANHSKLFMVLSSIDKLIYESEILDPAIYNLLINGLWKEDRKHQASRLLDLMLEKGWVPDRATHKLLIGSDFCGERSQELVYDKSTMQDPVSSVLAESLGSM